MAGYTWVQVMAWGNPYFFLFSSNKVFTGIREAWVYGIGGNGGRGGGGLQRQIDTVELLALYTKEEERKWRRYRYEVYGGKFLSKTFSFSFFSSSPPRNIMTRNSEVESTRILIPYIFDVGTSRELNFKSGITLPRSTYKIHFDILYDKLCKVTKR